MSMLRHERFHAIAVLARTPHLMASVDAPVGPDQRAIAGHDDQVLTKASFKTVACFLSSGGFPV